MTDTPMGKLGERRGSMRSRLVFLVTLPVIVLGTSYFLFVEYVLQDQWLPETGPWVALRVGGVFLVLIAILVAVTCGFLVVDRVTRPVRLLLRLVESGELESGGGVFLHHREWEIFHLYRRVHALVLQNRSAAEALAKLRQLEETLQSLIETLRRPVTHGVLPSLHGNDDEGQADESLHELIDQLSVHRARLLHYLAELTGQTAEIRTRVTELEAALQSHLANVGESKGRLVTALAAAESEMATAEETEDGPSEASAPRALVEEAESTTSASLTESIETHGNGHGDAIEESKRPVAGAAAAASTANSLAAGDNGFHSADTGDEAGNGCTESIEKAFGTLEHVRRLGVVAALEAERSAGVENRQVGEIFDRFQAGVSKLELALDEWVTATAINGSADDRGEPATVLREQEARAQEAREQEARAQAAQDHVEREQKTRLREESLRRELEGKQRQLQEAAGAALEALEDDPFRRLSEASRRIDESLGRLERRLAEVKVS